MKQLSLIEKAFFLKKISIFSTLDLDLLLAIADKMQQDLYDRDEVVFKAQQVANRMYLIVEGEISIHDEEKVEYRRLSAGDFFGDEALFNENPRSYFATPIKDTFLLTLSRTDLMTIISECPHVAVALLQDYTRKFPCRVK